MPLQRPFLLCVLVLEMLWFQEQSLVPEDGRFQMLAHGCPESGLEDDVSEADVSEDDAFDTSAWPLPCFGCATSQPSGLTGSTGAALILGESSEERRVGKEGETRVVVRGRP